MGPGRRCRARPGLNRRNTLLSRDLLCSRVIQTRFAPGAGLLQPGRRLVSFVMFEEPEPHEQGSEDRFRKAESVQEPRRSLLLPLETVLQLLPLAVHTGRKLVPLLPICKRRRQNPSLKRPECLVAPEQNSGGG